MPIQDVDELQQMLMSTWASIRHSVLVKATGQWQKDLMTVFVYNEMISSSCSDIACHVFYDCIKPYTFLTLLYCCKLLK